MVVSPVTGRAVADAVAPSSQPAVQEPPAHETVQQTLSLLASDALEGRGIGSPGLDQAADLIAKSFGHAGLKPILPGGSYFQTFDYRVSTSIDPATSLAVNGEMVELDKGFRPFSLSAESSFDAPLVFAGYGIDRPESGYNDYSDLDVKGKAVLILRYEPRDAEGNSRLSKSKTLSESATFSAKSATAAAKGAAVLIVVDPASKGPLAFRWGTSDGTSLPMLSISPAVAEQWLEHGSEIDLKALQTAIDKNGKPMSKPLRDVQVTGSIKLVKKTVPVKNVMAVLPGEGPTADEYIVVGAHYDHLGKQPGGFGHSFTAVRSSTKPTTRKLEIHNGADDNASGTTAILELANRMAKVPLPKRSILFVAFTGEEEGLVGSSHFVANPPVPLDKIAAMLNLDMVGRIRNDTLYVGGGGTAGAFKQLLSDIDAASPLMFKSLGEGGLGPSDHMSFALKKIPVLFLFSGLHTDYHRPSDDVEKINFVGLEQVTTLSEKLVAGLAAMPKQTYVATFDRTGMRPSAQTDPTSGRKRVTLGVVPDYTTAEDSAGVRISATVPDSPAATAGLQDGDVIVKLGAVEIESLEGLSAALMNSEAGKPTTVTVLRDGKRLEKPVTLAEKN